MKKKIYGHQAFYFVGVISKVDEQFVFAKKIVGNSS
jgi:hypothetical protein